MGRLGLTQREVSERIGMASSALSVRLNGDREFRESELVALARALETTVEHLVRGIDQG
jgi:transcriptional regulator with XRE-family HTH domain